MTDALASTALRDQAAGLRRLLPARRAGCIALTAASPHAGHGALAAELALALAQGATQILLADADDAAQGAAAWLGARPPADLLEALRDERTLQEVSVARAPRLWVARAQRALASVQQGAKPDAARLAEAFARICARTQTVLLVTAPGTCAGLALADRLLVVTRDDPGAITRSYALLKRIAADLTGRRVCVLLNGVRSPSHAERIFGNLRDTASRFLDLYLECVGQVPDDACVRRAAAAQRPVMELFPASPAARALRSCAARLCSGAPRSAAFPIHVAASH